MEKAWWKETIVYQIYPRSFQDSNGDGIGDLRGIINRLDYIKSLGVETIWLNPIFKSPNDDNGYDVSDYRDIMDDFGTMQDFDELLAGMKARGLRLLLDLVPNHSSDEHKWFQESRKSKDNPYRDYYYWKPPREDGSAPTNWVSYFAPSTWEYDDKTGEYYLHLFSVKQPDLNWENPTVRREIYDVMKFWLDKGIDGFRIDVLPFLSKNLNWPDQTPENFDGNLGHFYANGPRLHEFLHEMHEEVFSKYDCTSVGEGPGISPEQALLYIGKDREEIHTLYHFEHMDLDRDPFNWVKPKKWSLVEFKAINARWDAIVEKGGWNTAFLGNHDFPRMVSRWGNDKQYRNESAKLLHMYLLTQRATPYIYFGDEIGMTNVDWQDINQYDDLQVFDGLNKWKEAGGDEAEFVSYLPFTSRDNARTPFQWSKGENAGFTDGKPWIGINENYSYINKESQEDDEQSILNFFRKMTRLRRENEILVYGDYQDIAPSDPAIYAYTRTLGKEEWLIAMNFSDLATSLGSGHLENKKLVFGNYPESATPDGNALRLQPWEAVILKNE
ncbi:MAG: alpha-glucosidase [Saprospiraceae bacterium]|nr:alpha-glucosidase [Saprospiraceae bacterium]